jgi:hypothetical protein
VPQEVGTMNMRSMAVLALLASGVAHADHGPSFWALDEPIYQGDGVQRGTAVHVSDVVVTDTTGSLTLVSCCGLVDLAECPDTNTYLIEWTLDRHPEVLARGESVNVTLENTRIAGDCTDLDPIVVVSGDNGNPADSLTGLGVTFEGPVGIFDDAQTGGRYYTTNSDPHNDHDGSVRTVSVFDLDGMRHEGYWHIDVSHRWGLQYEFTWVYRATTDPNVGGEGEGEGEGEEPDGAEQDPVMLCTCAQPARGVPASLALLALLVLVRRRRRPALSGR